MRFLVAFALLVAVGCGEDTPVPSYPFPEGDPIEDTDLAQYFEDGSAGDEDEDDEEWDDGLSDEDLAMEGDEAPAPEPTPEPEAEGTSG